MRKKEEKRGRQRGEGEGEEQEERERAGGKDEHFTSTCSICCSDCWYHILGSLGSKACCLAY